MHMSKAQLLVLKAAILGETDATFVGYRNANDKTSMAGWYNVASTTVVWRTSVAKKDVIASTSFDWTRVDNLTVGKARIWDQLFSVGNIDASQANVRAGIDATWIGSAPDLAVRASVYVQCKRFASRFEKLYSTGTGSDAVPATLVLEGALDAEHIEEALETV